MSYYDCKGMGTSRGMGFPPSISAAIDAGLHAHMQHVYGYMAGGLALTGIVDHVAAASGFYQSIASTPLIWLAMLALLGFVLALSFGIQGMSAATAMLCRRHGVVARKHLLVFTGTSIARVFFITAMTYGAMSLYCDTIRTDLSRFGSFLTMGPIGIVIASLVNIFIKSNTLQFVRHLHRRRHRVRGLTAYATQRTKEMYLESDSGEIAGKKAVLGVLVVCLDFINLFMMLLQLLGQRRDN
jgi:FtsH-binding integral membrane protein